MNVKYDKSQHKGSIWIMGLSSSGKTTLAKLLEKKLCEIGCPHILLDGDQVREIFEERLGYDIESRRKQTRRVMRLAQWVSGQGILPVVAIIHPFEDDRARCRSTMNGYFEVYLKCDLKVCIERDTKNVYKPALEGKAKNVIGLDIPYDVPERPDLIIESDTLSPEEMFKQLWAEVEKRFFGGRKRVTATAENDRIKV
ncbi:MAG: adenylyl-sulfate kinase [Candidatus Omnitrophica bacterium]|nr:adenylyl-sulfate kinase [Candidatus Omnitrophota bacterium]